MTGYELLKEKLTEEYNASKVYANESFIKSIIKIMAENESDRMALEAAEADLQKAKLKEDEARRLSNEAYRNFAEAKRERRKVEERLIEANEKISECKELERNVKECETPEARDKLRLAYVFLNKVSDCEETPIIKGLSNILGNSNSKAGGQNG